MLQKRRPHREFNSLRKAPLKKKVCRFCVDKIDHIDYKDTGLLRKYLTDRSKLLSRRITGTCPVHQHLLTEAIKVSRRIALLSYKGFVIAE